MFPRLCMLLGVPPPLLAGKWGNMMELSDYRKKRLAETVDFYQVPDFYYSSIFIILSFLSSFFHLCIILFFFFFFGSFSFVVYSIFGISRKSSTASFMFVFTSTH